MKNILLINGKKSFGHSNGCLNQYLNDMCQSHLYVSNYDIKTTSIDNGYDIQEEVEKILWADVIIYQMPGWWMGPPWIVKKYIDEVFTAGHGTLYTSDGRTRSDSSKKYGSGGLLANKKFMLSLTWNAPEEAFNDPKQFFHGVGVDGVYLPFYKAHEFLGMNKLPTFICNDVMKEPDVEFYTSEYKKHLDNVFNT